MAPDKIKATNDAKLVNAYAEVIEQWGNHNIQYWKDKLIASRMEEGDVEITKATKTTKRKRSDSPTFRNPLRLSSFLGEDNVDDDEGLFRPIKKEPKDDGLMDPLSHENDRLYDNSDSEVPRSSKARKIGKFSASVGPSLFTPPTTPAKSSDGGTPRESVFRYEDRFFC